MTSGDDRTDEPPLDFGRLYRAHAPHARRFALFLTGQEALADDLVSEAFVRAWTARDRLQLPTVRSYLFAIVRNLYLHHLRQQRRQAPLGPSTADDRPGPEDRATGRSELRAVLAALAGLPEVDRAALLMRADGDASYEEIAVALGLSVSAAKVKVHRARLKLAEARVGGAGFESNGRRR
jgi:RNA polymerase sigma-70 factor, ECF subfamily